VSGRVPVADGRLLIDAEDECEVERVGAVGEGLFELAVDAVAPAIPNTALDGQRDAAKARKGSTDGDQCEATTPRLYPSDSAA
jgi:hypothetical protein